MLRAVVCVGVLLPAPAEAYVRYLSQSDCPYAWHPRSLIIRQYPARLEGLDEAVVNNAAKQAAEIWGKRNGVQAACTDLDVQVTTSGLADAIPSAKFDGKNNLVFLSDSWCPDPSVPCHDSSALAITSVFARTWGEIVDADIEVNADIFKWGDLELTPDVHDRQDIQNALTHEVGHFIGLDHTCYADPTRVRPLDDRGTAIPDCDDPDLPEEIRQSTMFASANPGDTTKRTLEIDDLRAVCEIYPRGRPDPLVCASPNTDSGCAIAAESGQDGGQVRELPKRVLFGVGFVAVALVLGLRRARTRRTAR